jgi:hypothetical protein
MMSPDLLNTLEKLLDPLQQEVLHYANFLQINIAEANQKIVYQ